VTPCFANAPRRAAARQDPENKAIIVYPYECPELPRPWNRGSRHPAEGEPRTLPLYTGRSHPEERLAILADPPDILLTNYEML
jgi:hypothetical protein